VVSPDDLVHEALATEEPIEGDLHVVDLAVVEVDEERAVVGQAAERGFDPRQQPSHVVVELVGVAHRRERLDRVGPTAEAAARSLRVGAHPHSRACLATPRAERRIDVDQSGETIRQRREHLEVVAVQDAPHRGSHVYHGQRATHGAACPSGPSTLTEAERGTGSANRARMAEARAETLHPLAGYSDETPTESERKTLR